jgi:hypothetical protein
MAWARPGAVTGRMSAGAEDLSKAVDDNEHLLMRRGR